MVIYRLRQHYNALEHIPEFSFPTVAKEAEFQRTAEKVKVGLYIRDFSEFNITKEEFTFSGIIWFVFDPTLVSLETIGKFSFEKGEILEKSAPKVRLVDNNALVYYDIKVKFTSPLRYDLFPFDDHRIYILFTNNFVSAVEVKFESSTYDFVVKPTLRDIGWEQVDRRVQAGYLKDDLDPYDEAKNTYHPRVAFALDYSRVGVRYITLIILPLLLLLFLAIFTFSLDAKKSSGTALSLAAGGVTGIIAYRFVMESMSPSVDYFMISDKIFFLFFVAIFFIFLVNFFANIYTLNQKRILVAFFHIVVMIFLVYFMWVW